MTKIKPHASFSTIRADEVAECWEGVGGDLYSVLWNVIVPHQRPIPNLEDSGPADHVGHECLASHWHRLDPEIQTELNRLARREERQWSMALAVHGIITK
jgi:hypothetical protein